MQAVCNTHIDFHMEKTETVREMCTRFVLDVAMEKENNTTLLN